MMLTAPPKRAPRPYMLPKESDYVFKTKHAQQVGTATSQKTDEMRAQRKKELEKALKPMKTTGKGEKKVPV